MIPLPSRTPVFGGAITDVSHPHFINPPFESQVGLKKTVFTIGIPIIA